MRIKWILSSHKEHIVHMTWIESKLFIIFGSFECINQVPKIHINIVFLNLSKPTPSGIFHQLSIFFGQAGNNPNEPIHLVLKLSKSLRSGNFHPSLLSIFGQTRNGPNDPVYFFKIIKNHSKVKFFIHHSQAFFAKSVMTPMICVFFYNYPSLLSSFGQVGNDSNDHVHPFSKLSKILQIEIFAHKYFLAIKKWPQWSRTPFVFPKSNCHTINDPSPLNWDIDF